MAGLKMETVQRFQDGANADRKQQFAKDLIEALDRAEVKPGQMFSVMAEGALDKLNADWEEKLVNATEAAEEHQAAADELQSLQALIEDWDRGIRTREELLDAIGVRA